MKVDFKESFVRDLKNIEQKKILVRIRKLIELVENADSLMDLTNLKKLKVGGDYFRVRVGDYRVGIVLVGDTVVFVRCLNRKDIYKYFP